MALLALVPKLRMGTQECETLFRVRAQPRNGVSKTGVPKQSLGTRGSNRMTRIKGTPSPGQK
jgi:hypothetical protein